MHYEYETRGTCSRLISFDMENGVVSNISFLGGCDGNLKALSKVLDGWTADEIEKKLSGNICGMRGTSCADQLAKAVRAASDEEKEVKV